MNVNERNSLQENIAQAIEEMKEEAGRKNDPYFKVNLAELARRTGISRKKLRNLKKNGFVVKPNGNAGRHKKNHVLSGFTNYIDNLLRRSMTNSVVIFKRLVDLGYAGCKTQVKKYIKDHKDLVPIPRATVAPQGDRARRYRTGPGEVYQMDWGFVNVERGNGTVYRAACFTMICHHCGRRYIEFFPNAMQENLFIGMIHAFQRLGVPKYVLTDNMKSVVNGRDSDGMPVWNHEYETFMTDIGFNTKLCLPRHPYTKGCVERLVRVVKGNFVAGRAFANYTILNKEALTWCDEQDSICHQGNDFVPEQQHSKYCMQNVSVLTLTESLRKYLAPVRKISWDGFVCYEGRRFGVPYTYKSKFCRVMRDGFTLSIYSYDMKELLVTHDVTWSRADSFCEEQFPEQPEEFPTAPVKASMHEEPAPAHGNAFGRFNFDTED